MLETSYKNGKKNGIEKWYNENGEFDRQIIYKDGVIIEGTEKWYDERSGNLALEIPYKNGKIEGIVKGYEKNGKLQVTLTYKNNEPISGKCSHGRALTEDDLYKVKRGDSFDAICNGGY